ncbi:MAG: hybrid sensor histidine kinase/response regulator [Planctomycetes bacterium]|nr:hybrid sensor histidine kinase/response regulator [Planctomycetota bacterium]
MSLPNDADEPEFPTFGDAPDAFAAISPEILEVFTAEAEEHLAVLGRTLPLYQQQPANKEYLQEIRRAAHTLKGAAASVGFPQIATLAHRAEDLLDVLFENARSANPNEISLLFDAHDALEDLAAGRAGEALVAELSPRFLAAVEAARVSGSSAPATQNDEPRIVVPVASEPPSVATDAAAVRAAGEGLRVPIARIDEVVNLVGELVISRSGFEQQLGKLSRLFQELELSAERLRRATSKLETQYEARALGSNRLTNRIGSHTTTHGFDGLEFDRYTDFHLMIRELAETSTDIITVSQELSGLTGEFDGYLVRQSRLTGEMQDKLMRVRMVPLAHLSSRLHRTVRHTANGLGKQVRLVLEGESTDLDKTVLDEMSEPLLHLLRNAIDHGIEDAATREVAGKPATGTIRVQASHESTQIVIRVSDDGRGIDTEAIRVVAVARGFLSAEAAAIAAPEELRDLLFQTGFSTAQQVSEISGRGVGLDIVKVMVERLKGTVSLASTPGEGTTFTVRLPLTLAVIRALMVDAEGQTFALPLGSITQILRLDPEQCSKIGGQDVVRLGDETLPMFTLAKRLSLRGASEQSPRPPAVVVNVADRRYVVVLDRIVGGREVVVKSLGTHVRHAPGIAGATLMGDGSVVLILDPTELCIPVRAARPNLATPSRTQAARTALSEQLLVLVVDDSPSVRRFVAGQLRDAGLNAHTAKDGLDALDVLHHTERLPDVVLLDVEMPRMDGYELLSTIRANPAHRHIPVVMLTSRAGDKHRSKAMELGATAYLVKPYQPAELLRVLREAASAPVPA